MSESATKDTTEILTLRVSARQMVDVRKDYNLRRRKDKTVPRPYTLSAHIRYLIDEGLTNRNY